jgi:hypothetical protein
MAGQPGFFDLDERYQALSASGDPLVRLSQLIDFEVFRTPLLKALQRSDRLKGGRPPYDPVLMFKILVSRPSTRCLMMPRSSRSETGSPSCAF